MSDNTGNGTYRANGNGFFRSNQLGDKVVLLIGQDTTTLRSLIIQLAEKGAKIVLIGYDFSSRDSSHLQDMVESAGSHFLFINGGSEQPGTAQEIVSEIIQTMGGLDILIDLSAKIPKKVGQNGSSPAKNPYKRWMKQDILEAVIHSP